MTTWLCTAAEIAGWVLAGWLLLAALTMPLLWAMLRVAARADAAAETPEPERAA